MKKIIAILLLTLTTGCMAHKHTCDMKPKGEEKCACEGCEHSKKDCDCGKTSCS